MWTANKVRAISIVSGMMLLTVAGNSGAAEWSVQPSLTTKGLYNSNLILNPAQDKGTAGYGVAPGVEFAGKTERFEARGRLSADFIGYFGGVRDGSGGGNGNQQITNVFVPLKVNYQTEKDLLGFIGGFTRDNTFLTELQTTGVAVNFAQRNNLTANPTWTRRLTEQLSLKTSAQVSYSTYERDLIGGNSSRLVDNRVVGGSGGVLYQLTERDQLELIGSYTEFRTLNSVFPIHASFPGVVMSLTHDFDESLTGTIYGGPKFLSSTTEGRTTSTDLVWVGGAKASKRFERAEIEVSMSRDLMPSGFGLLLVANRAEITGSYDVSETLTYSVNVVGALTDSKTQSATGNAFQQQLYASVRPAIAWKLSEWWQAELSYMYRWRDRELAPSAQSHAATVMFTYYPPKLSFSR